MVEGDHEFFEQAQEALERIRGEIETCKSQETPKPRIDFYESTRQLFEDLVRKNDFREIETLEHYVNTLQIIREKMANHAPIEEIRSLQVCTLIASENRNQFLLPRKSTNILQSETPFRTLLKK